MTAKKNLVEILIISLSLLLLLFKSSDPIFYGDSERFIKGSLKDPPIYSAIIYVMLSIFKNLNSVVILQTFIMTIAIIFFTKTLETIFNLDYLTKSLIAITLFFPTIKFYNIILSEPLGFAFSLFLVSFVCKLVYNFSIKNLVWFVIFTSLLLLTRNQFIILYPVILFFYLGIFYIYKSKKKFFLLLISFLTIFLIHNFSLKLNIHLKKDLFEEKVANINTSNIFTFMMIDAIYISTIKDVELFENENLRKTLVDIFEELDNQKASIEYNNSRGHFSLSFGFIKNNVLFKLIDFAGKENISYLNLKKKISTKLIFANYKTYLKLLFKKFYDSTWLFVFVPFFILIPALINFLVYKSNYSLLIIFITIFTLANHSVIYLLGRVQARYFIYSDFILLIFIFLSFSILLKKKITI